MTKRAKRKVLSPEQKLIVARDKASRALTMDELACAHLCAEYSMETAASQLGWDIAAVTEIWNRPAVQAYLDKAQVIFLHKLASAKIRLLKKVKAIPSAVESRLMELAMLEPDETGGRIDGQVKALELLAKILQMTDKDDPFKGKTNDEIKEILRAKVAPMLEAIRPQ